jgi:hypothetical protein
MLLSQKMLDTSILCSYNPSNHRISLKNNVRREHKEEAVPAERSALSFAHRAWPGA